MKTRSGLVSNSSSSSFIVALPKDQDAIIKVSIEFELHGNVIDTVTKLDSYAFSMFNYNPKDPDSSKIGDQKRYTEAKKLIESGHKLIHGRMTSESEDPMERYMMRNMCDLITTFHKNMIVVQSP